jgi:prophage antirepressor-like protein
MRTIQIFEHPKFGSIAVFESLGKTLFSAEDVAKALGYENTDRVIEEYFASNDIYYMVDEEDENVTKERFLTESEVYCLIIKSRLPKPVTEEFYDWISDEVLPAFRRTGSRRLSNADETPEGIMLRALRIADDISNRSKRKKTGEDEEYIHFKGYFEGNEVKFQQDKASGEMLIDADDAMRCLGLGSLDEFLSSDKGLDCILEMKRKNPDMQLFGENGIFKRTRL